jgi:general secretion pathway protein G
VIGRRGDKAKGRRGERTIAPSPHLRVAPSGFTLIELVITVAVLAILMMGAIPLVQVSVKRQKEQQLREALREMREAIDQFHREALAGAQMQVNQQSGATAQQEQAPRNLPQNQQPQAGNIFADPRVRVFITDQTIFTADNADRYPPDLDTLVKGVNVLPLTVPAQLQGGQGITGAGIIERSENSAIPKPKVYLRSIPIDPMTGKADWVLRSCYDTADSTSWGGENVFDVHSASNGLALNGEKYSDW